MQALSIRNSRPAPAPKRTDFPAAKALTVYDGEAAWTFYCNDITRRRNIIEAAGFAFCAIVGAFFAPTWFVAVATMSAYHPILGIW